MKKSEWVGPGVLAVGGLIAGLVLAGGSGVLALVLPWLCINALLAMSLRQMMLVGEVSLAIGAFYGIGAYTAAQLTLLAQTPLIVSVLVGSLVAALSAAIIGSVTLKVSGATFILVSFAFTEALRLVYTRTDWLGGNSGLIGIFADQGTTVTFMVCATVGVGLLLFALERSRLGRQFEVVEDKPLLASVSGISPWSTKMIAMTISGAVAGLSGGLFAHYSSVIAPTDFSYMISITTLAFVMIGGRRYLLGVVIGAFVLTFITEEMRAFGTYEPLVYGSALIVAMVLMPQGIAGVAVAAFRRLTGMARGSFEPPDDTDGDVPATELAGAPR
ncbi:branched-chain amino acid ABC transporter permease [Aeromicrobium sp. CTD01-1L150]|uniref:branched-chain amino acid ABC transporter permease n=1 Tax=Aeromicrobium sp. CTD01-1L150 TaxID=3341830 RepID=UPI0035C20655